MKTILALILSMASTALAVEFDAFQILPRQDDPAFSQTVKAWRLETSSDGLAWATVTAGTFDATLTDKTVPLTKQAARFVRFVALSDHTGEMAALAEINLSLAGGNLDRLGWIATGDDDATGYPAAAAIDGKPETCWHTAFLPAPSPYPHSITLDTLGPIVGDTVTLEWEANPETPPIAGYAIAYGTNPAALDKVQALGNVTTATITGLATGTWYFSLQARSTLGGVSGFTPPITAVLIAAPVPPVPVTPPALPKKFRVKR